MISSCNVEEPQEKMLLTTNEIGLNAVSKTGTKGYVEDVTLKDTPYDKLYDGLADDAKADRTITMSAWLYPQSGAGQEYFHAEKFAINANGETDNLWHHNPKVYWPLGGTLDFLAYSVNTDFPQTAVSWNREKPTDGLSLRVDRRYTQDDILFAAAGARGANRGAAVEMVFKHAQAWLEFNVHAEENGIVTFDAIEVENLYSDGRLDVKNVSGTTTASWNFDSNTALNTVVDDTPGAFGRVLGTSVRHFDMLVPQQPMRAFVIKYRLSGIDMPLQYRYELPVAYWEMGKKYIYDITLSPKEITVSPIVTEWDVVSEDWVYATATHIDAVGSTFTFSDRSLYYWRAEAPAGGGGGPTAGTSSFSPRTKSYDGTDAGGYELLQYVSGEYGDRVKFKSSTGEQVTMFSESIQRDVEIAVEENPLVHPFTIQMLEDGTVTYKKQSYSPLVYSVNKGEWSDYSEAIAVSAGDKVSFKAKTSNLNTYTFENAFDVSGNYNVSGNICYLVFNEGLDETGLGTRQTRLPERVFYEMFKGSNTLKSAEDLLLPAMHLSWYCYFGMFKNCKSLEYGPQLPATELIEWCYESMFEGCENLKEAPALPAMELTELCYHCMFKNCKSLEYGPQLPATSLANSCYHSMFAGCSNLLTAPELPALELSNECYASMFRDCKKLTTPPALPATVMKQSCYGGMFEGCTGLTQAPALPAMTLARSCYGNMFYGCTALTVAPDLPATTLAPYCYTDSNGYGMFTLCTGLTQAPALPAMELADHCYYGLFRQCSGLTQAPALPATTLQPNCYECMFADCTSLTIAPVLPATELQQSCYTQMFRGCSSLSYIKCLAQTNLSGATNSWVSKPWPNLSQQAVSATGTFVAANRDVSWDTGVNGIPSGWTVLYADEM